jgi:hypothetical protein
MIEVYTKEKRPVRQVVFDSQDSDARFSPFRTVSHRFVSVYRPFPTRFFAVFARLFSPSLREDFSGKR